MTKLGLFDPERTANAVRTKNEPLFEELSGIFRRHRNGLSLKRALEEAKECVYEAHTHTDGMTECRHSRSGFKDFIQYGMAVGILFTSPDMKTFRQRFWESDLLRT